MLAEESNPIVLQDLLFLVSVRPPFMQTCQDATSLASEGFSVFRFAEMNLGRT